MYFVPYVVRGRDGEKANGQIESAAQQDLAAIKGDALWQTDWESPYLSNPSADKFAMKRQDGDLLALAAY